MTLRAQFRPTADVIMTGRRDRWMGAYLEPLFGGSQVHRKLLFVGDSYAGIRIFTYE